MIFSLFYLLKNPHALILISISTGSNKIFTTKDEYIAKTSKSIVHVLHFECIWNIMSLKLVAVEMLSTHKKIPFLKLLKNDIKNTS